MFLSDDDQIEIMLNEAVATNDVKREALAAIKLSNGIGTLLDKYMDDGDWPAFKASVIQKVQVCFDQNTRN